MHNLTMKHAAGALLLLAAAGCGPKQEIGSHSSQTPEKTSASSPQDASEGFVMSVMESTQLNLGEISIGAGGIYVGPYLDEKGVRRVGLRADLSISVAGAPSQFQQLKVREGQTLQAAGYRIFVEKLNPGARGSVVLRLWAAPKPPKASKPAKRWPYSWFGRIEGP